MNRKIVYLCLVIAIIASLLVFGCAKPTPAPSPAPSPAPAPAPTPEPPMEPVTLKFNRTIHVEPSIEGQLVNWFAEQVEERTDGLITFEFIPPFSLTRPGEEIPAVASGLSDLEIGPPIYYPKDLFLNMVDSWLMLFLPEDIDTTIGITQALMEEFPALHEEYHKMGVQFLGFEVSSNYYLESRVPVTNLDDLKGKKISMSGTYLAKFFQAAGATLVPTTLPETPMALETGMIDGKVTPFPVTFPFKLYESAPYDLEIPTGYAPGAIIVINKDLFDSFPEDIQQIFIEVGREAGYNASQKQISEQERLIGVLKDRGNTFYKLSEEDRMRWAWMTGNIPERWILDGEAMGKTEARAIMTRYLELLADAGHKFPINLSTLPVPE